MVCCLKCAWIWQTSTVAGKRSESSWVFLGVWKAGRSPVPPVCSETSEARSWAEISGSRHIHSTTPTFQFQCQRSGCSCRGHHGSFQAALVAAWPPPGSVRLWEPALIFSTGGSHKSNWGGPAVFTLPCSVLWEFASVQGHCFFDRGSNP